MLQSRRPFKKNFASCDIDHTLSQRFGQYIEREISEDDCDFDFGAIAFIARKNIRWIRNIDLVFTETTGVLKSLGSLSHRIRAQGQECEKRGRFQHARTTTTNGKEVGFEPE